MTDKDEIMQSVPTPEERLVDDFKHRVKELDIFHLVSKEQLVAAERTLRETYARFKDQGEVSIDKVACPDGLTINVKFNVDAPLASYKSVVRSVNTYVLK